MILFEGVKKSSTIRGFTLLEVLVSLVLVGVTLAVVFSSFAKSLRVSDLIQYHLQANLLIENKISELQLLAANFGLDEGKQAINFNDIFGGSLVISNLVQSSQGDTCLAELDLSVIWPKGKKQVSTLIFNKTAQEDMQLEAQ